MFRQGRNSLYQRTQGWTKAFQTSCGWVMVNSTLPRIPRPLPCWVALGVISVLVPYWPHQGIRSLD